jgi:hypothetical protein
VKREKPKGERRRTEKGAALIFGNECRAALRLPFCLFTFPPLRRAAGESDDFAFAAGGRYDVRAD